MTTTTTTYHLRAVTDAATTKTHLGATERGNVTFCGARLIVKGDERFGGRYADRPFTASTDLATIDCGGCLRTAYWKGRKGSTWTAPKTGAAAKDAAAVNAQAGR